MDSQIVEIARRIRELREIMGYGAAEMAGVTGVSPEQYLEYESGQNDFSFTFLYKCAQKLGVDITELLTGEAANLSFYSVVRGGQGLPIRRRSSFSYYHLAARMKNKPADPFLVTAPYNAGEQDKPVALSSHGGQEFDYVLKGSLKVCLEGGHVEILNTGDSIVYDASHGHGMIAVGGADCEFLAVIFKDAREGSEL